MVGKNNNYVKESKSNEHFQRFALRKLSVGVVSVAVAAGFYVGDPQEAQAIFYDETTGKKISNTREFATGKTDETISFTKDPNEVVKELKAKGYVFDNGNAKNNVFTTGTTYDIDSTVHQYFKYYFTHATTTVTPDNPKTPADVLPDNPGKNYPSGVAKDDLNKTVTRTINITTPDGKTQTITQKAEFTRSATVDEVTGEVTYGSWSKNVVLKSVDVPNIPGYVPSASVPEITVTPNDQDMTINITYKKLILARQQTKAAMLPMVVKQRMAVQRLVKPLKTASQVKPKTMLVLNNCHKLVTPTMKRAPWAWQEQCLQQVLAWALALRRSVTKTICNVISF